MAEEVRKRDRLLSIMPPVYSMGEPETTPMRWYQRLNPLKKAYDKRNTKGDMTPLPIPFESYVNMSGSVDKIPVRSFSMKYERDLVYSSDLLSLIIRTKTNETFRNGIEISERFQSKCVECEREFEEKKVFCPYDGAETRLPDYEQWKFLNKFVQKLNRFDESLLTVMREVDTDVHIDDNGWLFLERNYDFSEDGEITSDEVDGILRFDGNMMRLIISRYGMGTTETGTFPYFCTEHRQEFTEMPSRGEYYCKKTGCGKQMLPAWYMAMTKAERTYYSPREIYHVKMYSNTQGYGASPIMAVWMKVNALLRMDKFILEAYSLQRAPQELLIVRGRKDSVHRAWEYLMQKSRENPNMVWPLVIEGDESKNNRVIEHETFSLKPIEWSWGEMRQEFRDVVGRMYGVQPIFATGSQTGGGLANEGLQIAVTTLAIKQSQHVWDAFLEFVSRQLGALDYRLKLNPNEQEDELRDLEVQEKRVAIAQSLQQFGFGVELHKDSKGRIQFSYEEKIELEEPSPEVQPDDMMEDGVPQEEQESGFPGGSASSEPEEKPQAKPQPPKPAVPPVNPVDKPKTEAAKKDMPPRDMMTLEEQREEQMKEQQRIGESRPVPREYGYIQAGLEKSSDLDRAWTRYILSERDIRLSPKEKDTYLICKVCGQDFGNTRNGLDSYISHVEKNHPEYVTAKTEKANYESAPGKKIKRNPTGSEDADQTNVTDSQNMNILEGAHAGGL